MVCPEGWGGLLCCWDGLKGREWARVCDLQYTAVYCRQCTAGMHSQQHPKPTTTSATVYTPPQAFKAALGLSDVDAAPVHMDVGRRILRSRIEAGSRGEDAEVGPGRVLGHCSLLGSICVCCEAAAVAGTRRCVLEVCAAC